MQKPPAVATVAVLLAAIATSAQAGRQVLLDVGTLNFEFSGQKWSGDTFYSSTVQSGTTSFALNVGTGTSLGSFSFDPHGRVTFANGSYIAPLFSSAFFPPAPFVGSLSWGSGQIDAQLLLPAVANPVYSDANLLPVYRFTWQGVCTNATCASGTPTLTFQALLVDRGNGDFDLDFNYGTGQTAPAGATAGYQLGSNAASYTGAFANVGPDYCFRGGVGGSCTAVVAAVPEPGAWALMAGGVALLLSNRRWRRR